MNEGQREGDGGKEMRLEPRDEGRFGPIVLRRWETLDLQQQGSFRSAIVTFWGVHGRLRAPTAKPACGFINTGCPLPHFGAMSPHMRHEIDVMFLFSDSHKVTFRLKTALGLN